MGAVVVAVAAEAATAIETDGERTFLIFPLIVTQFISKITSRFKPKLCPSGEIKIGKSFLFFSFSLCERRGVDLPS